MSDMSLPLGKRAASGILWTTFLSIGGRLATLLSQLLLAHLLVPADFGVLGLAYTITSFFDIIANFGIERVFLQRHKGMRLWTTQVFVLSLGLALVAAILMCIAAPLGAEYYNNERIVPLILIIALAMPFTAMAVVPQAKLKSDLRFRFLALYTSAELLAGQMAMVLFAWLGLGTYSFVLAVPLLAMIRLAVYWRVSPLPLRPLRVSRGWWRVLRRGSNVFSITVLTTCIGQGSYIMLGGLASAKVVGFYYFAYRLVAQPMMLLASNFTNVLRPALISMNGEAERQKRAALKTAEMLGLITVPICYLQAAVAEPGLHLLFGDRWSDSVLLLQALSIGLPFDAISWAAGCYLDARGQYGRSLRYQLMTAPLFVIAVYLGATQGGALGTALGVSFYYMVHSLFITSVVFTREGIALKSALLCFAFPASFGLIAFGGAYWLACWVRGLVQSDMLNIAIVTLVGLLSYLWLVRTFRAELYLDIVSKLPLHKLGLSRSKV